MGDYFSITYHNNTSWRVGWGCTRPLSVLVTLRPLSVLATLRPLSVLATLRPLSVLATLRPSSVLHYASDHQGQLEFETNYIT
ncbi:23784_t:CDS:2 [Cetraspora pellucida]|uniref:23784_t:CDS:1 n=1 Tax=Cetraspora pellucida TaxID=1433469 RepID=A0A9N8VG06_9GLOM|nr:23784_t:CDS:2 [Cetraspora pellucida]